MLDEAINGFLFAVIRSLKNIKTSIDEEAGTSLMYTHVCGKVWEMKYSANEIIQYVQEEDIKFIRLSFCDVFGNQKNIAIMPCELKKAFEHGIGIDASSITGFGDEMKSVQRWYLCNNSLRSGGQSAFAKSDNAVYFCTG